MQAQTHANPKQPDELLKPRHQKQEQKNKKSNIAACDETFKYWRLNGTPVVQQHWFTWATKHIDVRPRHSNCQRPAIHGGAASGPEQNVWTSSCYNWSKAPIGENHYQKPLYSRGLRRRQEIQIEDQVAEEVVEDTKSCRRHIPAVAWLDQFGKEAWTVAFESAFGNTES